MLPLCLALGVLLCALAPSLAHADHTGRGTYVLSLEADLAAIGISAAITSAWMIRKPAAPAYCAPLCVRDSVNPFDRHAAGNYRPDWRLASDLGAASVMAASVLVVLADEGWGAWISDMVVILESIAVTSAFNILTTMAVSRPRPFLYSEEAPLEDRTSGNARLSFPSGQHCELVCCGHHRVSHAAPPPSAIPVAVGVPGCRACVERRRWHHESLCW